MGGTINGGCSRCSKPGKYPLHLHVTNIQNSQGMDRYICCRCLGHPPCGEGFHRVFFDNIAALKGE